jgi:hypothetical protein
MQVVTVAPPKVAVMAEAVTIRHGSPDRPLIREA